MTDRFSWNELFLQAKLRYPHMYIRAVAFVVAMLALSAVQDHGLSVRGRVTDVSGKPIPSVEIVANYTEVKRIPRLTSTDEAGEYVISGLAAERIKVTATLAGFRDEQKAIYVADARLNAVDFTMTVVPLKTETVTTSPEELSRGERILSHIWNLPMQRLSATINPGNAKIRGEELQRQEITRRLRALDKEAIPLLIVALKDPDAQMRRNAAFLLMDFAAGVTVEARPKLDIQPALPELIAALEDIDDLVRSWSAQAIGDAGPSAAIALPALRRALTDPNEDVRRFARISIDKIEKN
jgi:hypothetical protein